VCTHCPGRREWTVHGSVELGVREIRAIAGLLSDDTALRAQAVADSAPKGQVEVTFPQKGNKVVMAQQGEAIGKVVSRAGMRVKFDCKVGAPLHVSIFGLAQACAPVFGIHTQCPFPCRCAERPMRDVSSPAQRPRRRQGVPGRRHSWRGHSQAHVDARQSVGVSAAGWHRQA
jgi:hypothetical protein